MLVVETIARIRRDHLVRGVPIKKIARDLRVSKNTVRKSVGKEIGERVFAEWLASQAKVEKTDKNIEVIVDALWALVQQGKLKLKRGGYLVRRGRGRLIVEPGEPGSVV